MMYQIITIDPFSMLQAVEVKKKEYRGFLALKRPQNPIFIHNFNIFIMYQLNNSIISQTECQHHHTALDLQNESEILDSLGRSALFYASCQGHFDACAFLIDHRHEWANISDRKGDTPMHVASYYQPTV